MAICLCALFLIATNAYFVKRDFGDSFRCPKTELWLSTFDQIQTGFELIRSRRFEEARELLATTAQVATRDLHIVRIAAYLCSFYTFLGI